MHSRDRLTGYLVFLLTLGTVYVVAILITRQAAFALAVAALTALVAMTGYKLIRRRGKYTMATIVVGLPLITALMFAGVGYLAPFARQQRTIDILRSGGVQFHAKTPMTYGEWTGFPHGAVVPTWFVDLFGQDSMSQVASVISRLDTFQTLPLSDLHCRDQLDISLFRPHEVVPSLSSSLIDWLNELKSPTVRFQLLGISKDDIDQLANLRHDYQLTVLEVERSTADLSILATATNLTLQGQRLTPEQVQQLSERLPNQALKLDGFSWDAGMLEQLLSKVSDSDVRLTIVNGDLDVEGARVLANQANAYFHLRAMRIADLTQPIGSLFFHRVQLDGSVSRTVKTKPMLAVFEPELSIDDTCRLVDLFRCETLHVRCISSDDSLKRLWKWRCLEQIKLIDPNTDKITVHERPDSMRSE